MCGSNYQEMKKLNKIILIVAGILLFNETNAQDISKKANLFLNTLSKELKVRVHFSYEDSERFNMNYIPIIRKGPTFHDFNDTQKAAAWDLLKSSLSDEGFRKSTEIMELEKILLVLDPSFEMPDGTGRDPLNYHFCIFGNPSPTQVWGWRFEGHHISLNFTSNEGRIVASTPTFMGSNPAMIAVRGQRQKAVLEKESELGLKLVNSLTREQLALAKFTDVAPYEIFSENYRKVEDIEKLGISYSQLNKEQQSLFSELLDIYIGNYIFEFSDIFRKKIMDAGIENLNFAWAGGLKEGIGHYYRIHGPMLLIEFDNTQNDANHIHSVVRDITNDFAENLLKEHYEREHR